MSERKPNTLAKRMGFQDPDLSTPEHDEIMIWLDTGIDTDQLLRDHTDTYPYIVEEKVWEKPIVVGRGYTVAFIDMWVRIKVPVPQEMETIGELVEEFGLYLDYGNRLQSDKTLKESDNEKVRGMKSQIKSFLLFYHTGFVYQKFAIEVKPIIPSVGELVRQIRHQQTYLDDKVRMVVCSPDTRFFEALNSQGIFTIPVIEWKDGGVAI